MPLLAWSVSPMPWAAAAYGRFCGTYVPEVYPGILDLKEIELLKYAGELARDSASFLRRRHTVSRPRPAAKPARR